MTLVCSVSSSRSQFIKSESTEILSAMPVSCSILEIAAESLPRMSASLDEGNLCPSGRDLSVEVVYLLLPGESNARLVLFPLACLYPV